MRRDCWTAQSPCPLAKELIPVHPRKVFYYLTTRPRQGIPADSSDIFTSPLTTSISATGKGGKRIISPSLSNASIDEDDSEAVELRKRGVFSPSPEVDLSVPDFDTSTPIEDDFHKPPTPAGSTPSGRSSLARDGSSGSTAEDMSLVHNHRTQSPPLEGDEKEFTQTASNMRIRGMSFEGQSIRQSTETDNHLSATVGDMHIDGSQQELVHDQEDGVTLFGGQHQPQRFGAGMMSSPFVRPVSMRLSVERMIEDGTFDVEKHDSMNMLGHQALDWELREPESIKLEDLDELLGGF